MRDTSPGTARVIEWGVAMRTLPGEAQCGDVHLVKPIASGVLLAVADGLGHGAEAAAAARAAVTALERHAGESPLALVERSHRALHGTRGAVLSLALVNRHERSLTWLGVGNVEGTLLYGTDGARRRCASRPATPSSSLPTASARASPKGSRPRQPRNRWRTTSSLSMGKARMMRSRWLLGL